MIKIKKSDLLRSCSHVHVCPLNHESLPLKACVCVLAAILWEWLINSRKKLLKFIFLSQNCIQGNLCS